LNQSRMHQLMIELESTIENEIDLEVLIKLKDELIFKIDDREKELLKDNPLVLNIYCK